MPSIPCCPRTQQHALRCELRASSTLRDDSPHRYLPLSSLALLIIIRLVGDCLQTLGDILIQDLCYRLTRPCGIVSIELTIYLLYHRPFPWLGAHPPWLPSLTPSPRGENAFEAPLCSAQKGALCYIINSWAIGSSVQRTIRSFFHPASRNQLARHRPDPLACLSASPSAAPHSIGW